VSRTALTDTGVRPSDLFHGLADLAFDLGLRLLALCSNLAAHLCRKNAEAKSRREHAVEHSRLPIGGKLGEALPKVLYLSILDSSGQAHGMDRTTDWAGRRGGHEVIAASMR